MQLLVAPNLSIMKTPKNSNNTISININEIPKMSLRILMVLIVLVILPFSLFHGNIFSQEISNLSGLLEESFFDFLIRMLWIPFVFIIFVILGVILHEAIHALLFSLYVPSKFKGIQFGFDQQHGIPFVHIKEPISVLGFRIGAAMPLFLLGVIPVVIGLYIGLFWVTIFGVIFTISASGDLLLISRTKGLSRNQKLKDLPDKIGFELV